jgi:hypothetical protein
MASYACYDDTSEHSPGALSVPLEYTAAKSARNDADTPC